MAIVRDLEGIKDFGTENPAPDQLVAEAGIKSVGGDCAYEKKGIDISFTLSMASQRGPRLGGNHTSFPYFIAVVMPDQTILAKERMTAEFNFSSDAKVVAEDLALHVFIPLSKEQQATGPDYRVLAGFQLTKEQFEDLNPLQK